MTAGLPSDAGENLERLGTGEKRSFDTPEQFLRLVLSWSAPKPNMQVGER